MTRRYRFRRMMAPTAGLSKTIWLSIAGLIIFILGSALCFKQAIAPALDWVRSQADFVLRPLMGNDADLDVPTHFLGGALLVLGSLLLVKGAMSAVSIVLETLNPDLGKGGMADAFMRRQQLARGPRIVAMGGGTGLSTLLKGLKNHSSNITAIVTVTDDGGSSGRLIKEKGMIPPGDIRNCLVALADAEKSMTDLFQHRFKNDSGSLSGHSLGNLLIAGLVDQAHGDFEKALELASSVLAIRGRVIPSTLEHVRLRAILEDGRELCGETAIVQAGKPILRIDLDPQSVKPHPEAVAAIAEADLIVIGPGSVYTSLIPNLLVPGIAEALTQSQAAKAFVCNVMTQPGESDSFSASQHVGAVISNVHGMKIFDYVLVNTGIPSRTAIEKYQESGQILVDPDTDRIRAMGFKAVHGDFTSESDFVRHDTAKVAARLLRLLED